MSAISPPLQGRGRRPSGAMPRESQDASHAENPVGAYGTAALVLSYALLIAGAVWPNEWLYLVSAATLYAIEAIAVRRPASLSAALPAVQAGPAVRAVLRCLALVVLVARAGVPMAAGGAVDAAWFTLFTAATLGVPAAWAGHAVVAGYLRRRTQLPVIARGLDLPAARLGAGPLLTRVNPAAVAYLDVIAATGAMISIFAGSRWPAVIGAVTAAIAGWSAVLALLPHAGRARALRDTDPLLATAAERVTALAPRIVLYFSGPPETADQVNMWLPTMERLERAGWPTLVILCDRELMPLLDRGSTPVLCVPRGADIKNFPLPDSVRIGLFPADTTSNIHLIRRPGIARVYIGHGGNEADSGADISPFRKVYDQVWVTDQVERERYLEVAVRDDEIVEVGRPWVRDARSHTPHYPAGETGNQAGHLATTGPPKPAEPDPAARFVAAVDALISPVRHDDPTV
jgi:hypothetical protein